MKTAISIPDPLFQAADRMAGRLGISRSELFSKAMAEYLESHRQRDVTAELNRIYGEEESAVDPALAMAQRASLPEEAW